MDTTPNENPKHKSKVCMKFITIILAIIVANMTLSVQSVQHGIVKEYNEKAMKTPLSGVELYVKSAESTASDKQGRFALQFLTLKPGEKVNVRRIEKIGYEIFNKEAIEQWNLNTNTPFVIVMCRSDKFKKIRDNYQRVASENYNRQFKKEQHRLAKLKEEGQLKDEELQKRLIELSQDYERQLDNLENYVDKFSRIDLSELSSVEQEIIGLVQQGEFEEAIKRYEEQNYLNKYLTEVDDIKEISSAIDQLDDIKKSKEYTRDSLLVAIGRQIETLKLAGGKENFDKINAILREVALSDTTNVDNIIRYMEFCLKQNRLKEVQDAFELCTGNNLPDEQLFSILMLKGNYYYLTGCLPQALDYQKKSLELAKLDSKKQSMAYHNIGTTLLDKEEYDDALKFLNLAKEIREISLADSFNDMMDLSTTYANIACVYENKRNPYTAIEYYQKAITLQKEVAENDFSNYGMTLANTYNSLGALCHEIKDNDAAKENYLFSLNVLEKAFNHNPLSSALTYACALSNYGALLNDIQLYEQSLDYYNKAEDAFEFLSNTAPVITAHPHAMMKVNLGNTLIFLGRLDEAKTIYEEAYDLFERISTQSNPYVDERVTILSNSAIVLCDLNNIFEAQNAYKKAYDICISSKEGSLSTEITKGRTYFNIGNFYSTKLNEQQRAIHYFRQSISQFSTLMQSIPQMSAFVSMSLNGLAYCYLFQGDYENAIASINQAIAFSPDDSNFVDSKIEIQYNLNDKVGAKQTLDLFIESNPNFDIQKLPSYKLIYGE